MMNNSKIETQMLEPQLNNELKAGELLSAQVLPNPVLAAVLGRDLRRGNYVQQGLVEVKNTTSAYCYIPKAGASVAQKLCGNYYKFEDIKPLLITEDILKSFDFKNNGMGWHSPNNKLYYSEGNFKFVEGGMFLKLKAVHQLQNVYYDLFGEWLS